MTSLTAVVLAGERPGGDPLAHRFNAPLKALIAVNGEPMVRRPVAALLGTEAVTEVRVLAQQMDLIAAALPLDARLIVAPSASTIAETLAALCADPDTRWPVLVTTADHALLAPAMVRDFLAKACGADVAIGLVERGALMARLPETRRTWLRFRGGAYSGANLFLLGSARVAPAIALWRSVEQDRKKGWRVLSLLGLATLLGAALRLLTLDQVLGRAGRKLGLTVRAVRMSDPLAAVDVDKPDDHALVEAILAGRA